MTAHSEASFAAFSGEGSLAWLLEDFESLSSQRVSAWEGFTFANPNSKRNNGI